MRGINGILGMGRLAAFEEVGFETSVIAEPMLDAEHIDELV